MRFTQAEVSNISSVMPQSITLQETERIPLQTGIQIPLLTGIQLFLTIPIFTTKTTHMI